MLEAGKFAFDKANSANVQIEYAKGTHKNYTIEV